MPLRKRRDAIWTANLSSRARKKVCSNFSGDNPIDTTPNWQARIDITLSSSSESSSDELPDLIDFRGNTAEEIYISDNDSEASEESHITLDDCIPTDDPSHFANILAEGMHMLLSNPKAGMRGAVPGESVKYLRNGRRTAESQRRYDRRRQMEFEKAKADSNQITRWFATLPSRCTITCMVSPVEPTALAPLYNEAGIDGDSESEEEEVEEVWSIILGDERTAAGETIEDDGTARCSSHQPDNQSRLSTPSPHVNDDGINERDVEDPHAMLNADQEDGFDQIPEFPVDAAQIKSLYLPPPLLSDATAALVDLQELLRPRHKKGPGHQNIDQKTVFRGRLEMMKVFLNLYVSDAQLGNAHTGCRWMETSLLAAKAAGRGMWLAHNLRMWALNYINNREAVPSNIYG